LKRRGWRIRRFIKTDEAVYLPHPLRAGSGPAVFVARGIDQRADAACATAAGGVTPHNQIFDGIWLRVFGLAPEEIWAAVEIDYRTPGDQ